MNSKISTVYFVALNTPESWGIYFTDFEKAKIYEKHLKSKYGSSKLDVLIVSELVEKLGEETVNHLIRAAELNIKPSKY